MTLETPPDALAETSRAYRRALGAFPTGVCVITADSVQGPLGITVNSFTSVSLDPRLVLWCLDERSTRWQAFADAEAFNIHVLAADGEAASRRFAKGPCELGPEEFARQGGAPILPGALARFDCVRHAAIEMGDHMIIVGRVEGFEADEGAALTFWRGRYGETGA